MFLIEKFVQTNEVEVIPKIWLFNNGKENLALWPPYSSLTSIQSVAKQCEKPGDNWKPYSVKILKSYGKKYSSS